MNQLQIVKMRGHLEDINYWLNQLRTVTVDPDLIYNMIADNVAELRLMVTAIECDNVKLDNQKMISRESGNE
jgi:hypothetical protein